MSKQRQMAWSIIGIFAWLFFALRAPPECVIVASLALTVIQFWPPRKKGGTEAPPS